MRGGGGGGRVTLILRIYVGTDYFWGSKFVISILARRLRAKFWPDCAIPDTSMKFGTVVDHE